MPATILRVGNPDPHESYRVEVKPDEMSYADLKAKVREAGGDENGNAETLAARLSAINHRRAMEGGARETVLTYPEDMGSAEIVELFTKVQWPSHSPEASPEWVESSSEAVELLLSEHYDCQRLCPEGWAGLLHGDDYHAALREHVAMSRDARKATSEPKPKKGRRLPPVGPLSTTLMVVWAFLLARLASMELRTAAGRDFQSRVMGDTASTGTGAYVAASYIGLSEATRTPNDADTFLTNDGSTVSEIWNSGGGLNRAQATYSHTAGATSYLLSKTFTKNSSDGSSRTINKIGVFNAPAASAPNTTTGSLVFTSAVTSPPVLATDGDAVTVNETVNI